VPCHGLSIANSVFQNTVFFTTELVMTAAQQNGWQKIGEVAKALDIAVETIRMYEREGLLLVHKTASGQRLFNQADVHWISCIRCLIKEQGLNLQGIRRMLSLLPCWRLKPCSEAERKNCPAYIGATRPCWMMKTGLSGNCRAQDCRDCIVYQSASQCENLKSLLRKQQGINSDMVVEIDQMNGGRCDV